MREALIAGARSYVQKSDAGQHLISAVQSLAEHKPYFTDRASQVLLKNFLTEADKVQQILTDREQVVVQLVAEGHSNKEAAAVLNVSIKTIETHRSSIMRKLDSPPRPHWCATPFATIWFRLKKREAPTPGSPGSERMERRRSATPQCASAPAQPVGQGCH